MTRRQKVLGMPIGPKKKPIFTPARAAGAAAAAAAIPAIAFPVARKAGSAIDKGEHLIEKGQQVAGQASEMAGKANSVKEAVSSHSSTIGKAGALVSQVAKLGGDGDGGGGKGGKPKLAHLLEQHTDIAAPREVVYNQWTQMELFPTLVKGVDSVRQDEDDKATWTSKIGPSRRTWSAKIVEQVPDEKIAWVSEGGANHQGVVSFHRLDEDLTRVLVQIEYKPSGAVETVGNTLRIQRRRVKRDLRLFKHFVEMRAEETGAWRGRIDREEQGRPRFAGQGGADNDEQGGDEQGSDEQRGDPSERSRGEDGGNSEQTGGRSRGGERAGSSGRQASKRSAGDSRPAKRPAARKRPGSGSDSPERAGGTRKRVAAARKSAGGEVRAPVRSRSGSGGQTSRRSSSRSSSGSSRRSGK